MTYPPNEQETTALMGAITAPATHDLMNVLAIIGEHAGLLTDLMFLKKEAISGEDLARGLSAIESQVLRGRALLSQLNRLAHAPDNRTSKTLCDVGAVLDELVQLTFRQFHMRLEPPILVHLIACDPMALRLLIHRILRDTSHPTQAEETPLTMKHQGQLLTITVHRNTPVKINNALSALAENIGASLVAQGNTLTLTLPKG